MPCPLFVPESNWGHCTADPPASISQTTLDQCCNRGYARGVCERAAQSDADATSFMLKAIRGDEVEIAWAIERNHHPVAVGTARIVLSGNVGNLPLDRQMRAYAETCLWPNR